MYLFLDIGKTFVSEIVQILAGCLLSAIILKHARNRAGLQMQKLRALPPYVIIMTASILGVILPLGTYGVIPIAAAIYAAGGGYYSFVPLIISNAFFNMLTPFTDAGFVWRTGFYRILAAFIIGVCSGYLLKLFRPKKIALIRTETITAIAGKPGETPGFLKYVNSYFGVAGPYLIAGVILNAVFMKYAFYSLMNQLNLGQITSALFSRFRGYDITTPVFLLAMAIYNVLTSIKTFSALLVIFKWKGVIGYYIYFSTWIILIALINILS